MTFFVLGSNQALSVAELAAVYGQGQDFSRCEKEILLLEGKTIDPREAMDRLSGVIKAGSIVSDPFPAEEARLTEEILKVMPKTDRVTFGISIYAAGDEKLAGKLSSRRQAMGIAVKRRASGTGKTRFVGSKTAALASVAVETNGLVGPEGVEICLFATKAGVLLGKTEAVQDFKSWSQRDFGRPGRDPRSGMLPPKLARLMINLTGLKPEGQAVLDPFCGSGTILMEAALLGFPRVIGGDISEKAIADSEANAQWLETSYHGPHPVWPEIELHQSKAEDLPEEIQDPVDAIVTEPYLGPPLKGRESPETIRKNAEELRELYRASFTALAATLKRGGRLVAAIPAFRLHGLIPVEVVEDFRNIGFKRLDPMPNTAPKALKSLLGPQGGLLYEREGQKVAREILVFERI